MESSISIYAFCWLLLTFPFVTGIYRSHIEKFIFLDLDKKCKNSTWHDSSTVCQNQKLIGQISNF